MNNFTNRNDPDMQMKRQRVKMTNETLDVAENLKQLAVEANEIGSKTLQELDSQGEQLDNIDREMDNINDNLRRTQKTLKKMNRSILCGIPSIFSRSDMRQPSPQRSAPKRKEQKQKDEKGNSDPVSKKQHHFKHKEKEKNYTKPITGDAREVALNECLKSFDQSLTALQSKATDMTTEIKSQNKKLEDIGKRADANDDTIKDLGIKAVGIIEKYE